MLRLVRRRRVVLWPLDGDHRRETASGVSRQRSSDMTLMARSYDTGPIEWQHAHHTTLQSRLRRCAVGVMIGLLVATPAAGALAQDLEVADPIAAAAQEASGWPDFDPSDMSQEVAETEARQAVAGWPDFDPSDMSQEVAATEAQQEAAAWPDFDPSDMSQEVAIDQGAAGSGGVAELRFHGAGGSRQPDRGRVRQPLALADRGERGRDRIGFLGDRVRQPEVDADRGESGADRRG